MGFKHLILLVGTNPLPSFVVADYYMQKSKDLQHIWFVHSERTEFNEGTGDYAKNIKEAIKKRHPQKPVDFHYVPLSDINSAKKISHDINQLLIGKLNENCAVHLNYTGGTKAMGIHSYLALKAKENSLNLSFSYLDARSFRIVEDESGNKTEDLRNEVELSFNEIIRVHGFERKNSDSTNIFAAVVSEFREIINEGHLKGYFGLNNTNGYDRTLFENKYKRGRLAKSVSEVNVDKVINYNANDEFKRILEKFPEGYNPVGEINSISNNNFKKAVKFLDGEWFEEYIFAVLKEKLTLPKMEILNDWEIKKNFWKSNFQIDVILVKGYQLSGISCTTSPQKDICKSKGFEIIHRTRQMGGEESKAVLITLLDDRWKETVREDLLVDTGSSTSNILVLGIEDVREDDIVSVINKFIS